MPRSKWLPATYFFIILLRELAQFCTSFILFSTKATRQARASRFSAMTWQTKQSGSRGSMRTLMPHDLEVAGLLALMLLTDAHRSARIGPQGRMIPLDKQERTLWDRRQIDEGVALISAVLPKGSVGPYQIQAAIAAVHDEAARSEDTDGHTFSRCIASSNACPTTRWFG